MIFPTLEIDPSIYKAHSSEYLLQFWKEMCNGYGICYSSWKKSGNNNQTIDDFVHHAHFIYLDRMIGDNKDILENVLSRIPETLVIDTMLPNVTQSAESISTTNTPQKRKRQKLEGLADALTSFLGHMTSAQKAATDIPNKSIESLSDELLRLGNIIKQLREEIYLVRNADEKSDIKIQLNRFISMCRGLSLQMENVYNARDYEYTSE